LLTLDPARRGNLPWPNANFVGRELELASLRAALLNAPEQFPAGIHSLGGMGKTALAQDCACAEGYQVVKVRAIFPENVTGLLSTGKL
jgi:hypothetical protein